MKRGSAPEVVLKSSKLNLKREQKRPTIVLKDEKLQPSVIFRYLLTASCSYVALK